MKFTMAGDWDDEDRWLAEYEERSAIRKRLIEEQVPALSHREKPRPRPEGHIPSQSWHIADEHRFGDFQTLCTKVGNRVQIQAGCFWKQPSRYYYGDGL